MSKSSVTEERGGRRRERDGGGLVSSLVDSDMKHIFITSFLYLKKNDTRTEPVV